MQTIAADFYYYLASSTSLKKFNTFIVVENLSVHF